MANIYELPLPDGSIVQVEGERPPTRDEWMRAIGPKFEPTADGRLPRVVDNGLLAKAQAASGAKVPSSPAGPSFGEQYYGSPAEYRDYLLQNQINAKSVAARQQAENTENMIGVAGLNIVPPVVAGIAAFTPGLQPAVPAILSVMGAGASGNALGQLAQGRNPVEPGNLPELVASGLLAPIGAIPAAQGATLVPRVVQGLTEGLTVAAGQEAARAIGAGVRGEEYSPDAQTAWNFGLGAGLGTLGRAAERAPAPPVAKIEPAPATAASDAAQAASNIKQQGGGNAQATLTELSMGQATSGLQEAVPTAGVATPFDAFIGAAGATRAANTAPVAKERILQQLVDDVSLAEAQRSAEKLGVQVDSAITEKARARVLRSRQQFGDDVDAAIENLTTRLESGTPPTAAEVRPTTQELTATPEAQTDAFNARQKESYDALTANGVPAKQAKEAARALAGTTDPQEYQLIYQGALERYGKVAKVAPAAKATTRQLRSLDELTPEAVGLQELEPVPISNALPEPTPASVAPLAEPQAVPLQEAIPAQAQAQAPRVDRRQLLHERAAAGQKKKIAPVEPSVSAPPESIPAEGGAPAPQAAATPIQPALSPAERDRLAFLDRKFARGAITPAEDAERAALSSPSRPSSQAGFASGPVTSGLSGSVAGGAAGYLSTEKREDETDQEFKARRLANTVIAGLAGGAGTVATAEVLGRVKMPKPNRANPNLPNDLLDVLNRTEKKAPIGERLEKLYLDTRYNLDSKSSTLRYVQRKLADNMGKSVTFGGVDDLGAAYESLPAAVARAGLWVRTMGDVVKDVPKPAQPWMETLVAGRRVLSRLESNERNNVRMLDELQQAQIDLADARQANASYDKFLLDERSARDAYSDARKAVSKDPTQNNWHDYWQAEFDYNQARQARIDNAAIARGIESAKDRVTAANNAIKEGFDRKRTGKFGLPGEAGKVDIADQIKKTEDVIRSQFGPQTLAQINQKIDIYQQVMRGGLQETVRAGLLSPAAYRRIIADNDFYAPFAVLREIDEEVKRAGPAGKIGGVASSAAVTRAIKGISNPDFKLDNIFAVSAEQLFNNSIRSENNRFMRRFATLSRQDPNADYIARLPEGQKPRAGYEVISYLDAGVPRRLEVTPEIARVLGSVDGQNADLVANAIRTGGNVFKMFVTGVNPFFQIPNYLFYDSTRANIFSRYGLGQGPQRYGMAPAYMLTDALPALLSSARANLLGQQDELYKRAIDTGVLSGVFSRYLRPQAFKSALPSGRSAIDVLKDNRFGVDPVMNYWGRIGAVLEEATKIEGTKRAARWHMVDVPVAGAGPNTTATKKIPLGQAEKLMGASAPEIIKAWKEAAYDIRNYYGSPDFSVRGAMLNSMATYFPFAPAVQRAVIADFQKMFPVSDVASAARGKAFDKRRLAEAGATWGRMFQFFGIPALGVAAINALPENKADYDRLPEYAREGNVNIPLYDTVFPDGTTRSLPYIPAPIRETLKVTQTPAYFQSERVGEPIREYVRIPLQGNFNRAFNALANTATSEASGTDGYMDAVDTFLTNSSPVNVAGNTLGERAMSVVSSTNPIIRAPFEQAANMNFFTKRPIVDENKLNASDPLLQFDPERNVSLVKGLAESVPDWLVDAAPALGSPQRLEGGIRAMTGNLLDLAKPSTLSPDNPAGDANPLLGRFYRSEAVDTSQTREMAQQAEGLTVDQNIIDDNTAREYLAVLEDPARSTQDKRAFTQQLVQQGKFTDSMASALEKRVENKALGRGSDDRIVQGLNSTEAKARFYLQKIASFGGNRAAIGEYLKDQVAKELFTDAVAEEMARLSQAPQVSP